MNRRKFIKNAGVLGAGMLISRNRTFASPNPSSYPTVRIPLKKRNFTCPAIEKAITEFQNSVKNKDSFFSVFQVFLSYTVPCTTQYLKIYNNSTLKSG